ncbi:MAG: hypothetical protein WC460_04095 [Patescibacteria group bacterium]
MSALYVLIMVLVAVVLFLVLMGGGDDDRTRRQKFVRDNPDLCNIITIEPDKEYLVIIKSDVPIWVFDDYAVLKQGLASLVATHPRYYLTKIWTTNGSDNPDEMMIRMGYRVFVLNNT